MAVKNFVLIHFTDVSANLELNVHLRNVYVENIIETVIQIDALIAASSDKIVKILK